MRFLKATFCCIFVLLVLVSSSMGQSKIEDKTYKTHHKDAAFYFNSSVWKRLAVVTGGQTGTDRAAMDIALELKLPLRGWCPKGRLAEDGTIHSRYPLQETVSEDPALRTELNVIDSDGTLILSVGEPKDGTPLTETIAREQNKPLLQFDLEKGIQENERKMFRDWIDTNRIKVLNIAGPRESHRPGFVYEHSKSALLVLLRN